MELSLKIYILLFIIRQNKSKIENNANQKTKQKQIKKPKENKTTTKKSSYNICRYRLNIYQLQLTQSVLQLFLDDFCDQRSMSNCTVTKNELDVN